MEKDINYYSSIPEAKTALAEMERKVRAYEALIPLLQKQIAEAAAKENQQQAEENVCRITEAEDQNGHHGIEVKSSQEDIMSLEDGAINLGDPDSNLIGDKQIDDKVDLSSSNPSDVAEKDDAANSKSRHDADDDADLADCEPKDVVKKFVSVLKDWITGGDVGGGGSDRDELYFRRLATLCTPDSEEVLPWMVLFVGATGTEATLASLESLTICKSTIEGDNANVGISIRDLEGVVQSPDIPLRKINGAWKVDLKESDLTLGE